MPVPVPVQALRQEQAHQPPVQGRERVPPLVRGELLRQEQVRPPPVQGQGPVRGQVLLRRVKETLQPERVWV